eukprot:gene8321-9212_t
MCQTYILDYTGYIVDVSDMMYRREVQSATDLVNVDEVGFIQLKDHDNINHSSFNIQGQIRWIKPEVIISLKKKGQAESDAETEPGPSKRTTQSSESQKQPMCVNSKCSKKVQICDSFAGCNDCDRKMLAFKCPSGLICTVDIIHNEKQICLTIFPEQLNKFFEEDVIELYANNPKELEEKILLLESMSLSYNKKNMVTEINK